MKTRDIIIIFITIILLLSIGAYLIINSSSGQSTTLTMTNSPYLYEGDSLILKLTDANGTGVANQKVQINLTHASNGITENFTLKTNSKGECKLEDLPADNFTLLAKYPGNKKLKAASLSGNIFVKKIASNSQSNNKNNYKSDYKADDVIDGWDPKEHEVSREDLGDGTIRITYDDGYFRIVDQDGNILTYGY